MYTEQLILTKIINIKVKSIIVSVVYVSTSGRMVFKRTNMLSPPFFAIHLCFDDGEVTTDANATAKGFGSLKGRCCLSISLEKDKRPSQFF